MTSRARTIADFGDGIATADIDDGAVTAAKLFSGFANGVTVADQYRLTVNTNTTANAVVSSNIERVDDAMFSPIGSAMSVSSGVFTFPETGIYLVTLVAEMAINNDDFATVKIEGTQDNSSYDSLARATAAARGNEEVFSVTASAIVDVTNTTTHKVRFSTASFGTNVRVTGATDENRTHFTFIRLGDT